MLRFLFEVVWGTSGSSKNGQPHFSQLLSLTTKNPWTKYNWQHRKSLNGGMENMGCCKTLGLKDKVGSFWFSLQPLVHIEQIAAENSNPAMPTGTDKKSTKRTYQISDIISPLSENGENGGQTKKAFLAILVLLHSNINGKTTAPLTPQKQTLCFNPPSR